MTVEAIRSILAQHRHELDELGVATLRVFGSVARGEAEVQSDIDFLVEFSRPIGLFHFAHVALCLEDLLGRPVDLVMPDALKPPMRDRVLQEAVLAA
ncbi:MAG: nucleotidyltransferase family protein [Armatimonadetes bacterium]|nr:nucleotidyltransferase family protein [Armatimonadota bacterium]